MRSKTAMRCYGWTAVTVLLLEGCSDAFVLTTQLKNNLSFERKQQYALSTALPIINLHQGKKSRSVLTPIEQGYIRRPAFVFSSLIDSDSHKKENSSESSDEDFVFIAPTSLYLGDPNDQRYSASDWLQNIKSLPRSTILRAIQGPVVTVMFWSFWVSIVHGLLRRFGCKAWSDFMCISSKPHSFLVSALGLLLVFRTNSAYQRFAEGRKIWENILSISRNISRLGSLYEKDLGGERRHRIFRLLGAFPYLLHRHIIPGEGCLNPSEYKNIKDTSFALKLNEFVDWKEKEDYYSDIASSGSGNIVSYLVFLMKGTIQRATKKPAGVVNGSSDVSNAQRSDGDEECNSCIVDKRSLPWCLLPPSALRKCADSVNRPLWVCDRLSQEMTNVPYSDNFTSRERLAFLSHVDRLSQCIGACERIHQTAVPLNYARHSLRSLTIWLFSLPFALVDEFGLLTAPVMGVISWLLFGVYQIGYTIEDPFQGSLRLSILSDLIYNDVMYGADLKSRRDSAFHLEEEIVEWNRMGLVNGETEVMPSPQKQRLSPVEDSTNISGSGDDPAPTSDFSISDDSSSHSYGHSSTDAPTSRRQPPNGNSNNTDLKP